MRSATTTTTTTTTVATTGKSLFLITGLTQETLSILPATGESSECLNNSGVSLRNVKLPNQANRPAGNLTLAVLRLQYLLIYLRRFCLGNEDQRDEPITFAKIGFTHNATALLRRSHISVLLGRDRAPVHIYSDYIR